MSASWAVRLPLKGPNPAAALRLERGIAVHQSAGVFWLKGDTLEPAREQALRKLPDEELFEVLSDGQLRPWASRLPRGKLPDGPWSAILSWFPVELPVARLAGRGAGGFAVSLVRSSEFETANLLVARPADWLSYAGVAPKLRLERLSFALSRDGRVLIRGEPLPPMAGVRFYERSQVAVPCGWKWPAGIDAATVRAALELEASELALFSAAGGWERIVGDDFVRATRSAVRLSIVRERA